MTTLYKLTDQNGYTRAGQDNACLWGEGVSHSGTGEGGLCGPGWIHAYEHPLLAAVFNPIHAGIANPRMWVAEGEIAKRDGQLKVGCATLTTVMESPLPVISPAARVRFAIMCAKLVCDEPAWTAWSNGWLSGKDRSEKAAEAAEAAAWAAAEAAAWAAGAAAEAAWAAGAAAKPLAWAAVAWAARAAEAAAGAAAAAARAGVPVDLIALLEQAIRDEAVFEAAQR